jgi:hypothetical protein
VGKLPCSSIRNAVLSRRIPAAMSCRAALEPSTPAAATAAGRDAQPGAATLMLVLTIGWAATATPVASPPIEVLPVPAVYAPSPPPKLAIHEFIGSWYDADLPVGRSPVANLSTPVDSLQRPLVYCWVPS